MSNYDRPLSPHISIYRWPITMALSILHRISGIGLSVGFIVLVAWLFDAASGPDAYAVFMSVMDTLIGKLLLVAWSFAFFYHLSNGARHLLWDTGRGLEKSQANLSSWLVLIATVALTAAFWWLAS
ncbi:MAG: succinate dehydrogenase, cytochrome b556 subunit [Gammaproteobacteria bacterium]|nr:succinate dehydrogenase, cytochrome b556 subunit [Gammaproteobacteria bacterium]MBT8109927.1 succinate dehydrogenase, cytochrome b556 subunit [Gammaproteobacteria bacterium]NND47557.1 succinate dehydrogenase, cytochrome b556 subunit [Woeseiaceae bacterium]NNL44629.1 succinate dehydrogenase, cytochrome b556 subunit [Woeseiaceae bacterium]